MVGRQPAVRDRKVQRLADQVTGRAARVGVRADPDRGVGLRRALLVLPGLAFLTVLFFYPVGGLIGSSVYDGRFTVEHYRRLVTVPAYARVLWSTVATAGLVTGICLALGYPLAYRLYTAPARWRLVLLIGILVPFWTNLLVRAYGWMVILHPRGLLNTALGAIGVIRHPLPLVHNTTGVLIGMTQVMLPYMVLPIAAVMEGVDRSLLRAAQSLGASPGQTFLHVFLALTLPGVFAGCLLVFIIALGFFVIPALLGGARDLLLAQLIYFNVSVVLNWGFAAALSTVLLAITLAAYVLVYRRFGVSTLWGRAR